MQASTIVSYCSHPPKEHIIQREYGSNVVVRLDPDTVVKFGQGVTRREADNQVRAFQMLNHQIVRVPRVHGFFIDDDMGYLVMEYIEGRKVDPANRHDLDLVTEMMRYFATLQSERPGNLSGGSSHSNFFPEGELFDTVSNMTIWFDERLFADDPTFSFSDTPLILCHLDIAPRNLIITGDGSLCLLDWGSAGYYPKVFEICSQHIMGPDDHLFNEHILAIIGELSPDELAQKDAILRVWANELKYSL